jgi:hypothetical protein
MIRNVLATALLFAAPTLAQAQVQAPDYSHYQSLLDRYCIRLVVKGKPPDTRFDYEQLYVDEKIWTLHRSPWLDRVRADLLSVQPSSLSEHDRLAWAINTYNFLVIERATLHLLIPNQLFTRYKSVEDIRTPEGMFFLARVAQIEGRWYTLAEFERHFVYGDSTPILQPRTRAADPRIAMALCSGRLGDPPLAPRAFRGDSLEVQLDLASRTTLALPRYVRFIEANGTVAASGYLMQRLVDFGGTNEGVVPFLERYGPPDVSKGIHKRNVRNIAVFLPVDRTLNQYDRPKPKPPGVN